MTPNPNINHPTIELEHHVEKVSVILNEPNSFLAQVSTIINQTETQELNLERTHVPRQELITVLDLAITESQ